MTTTPQFLRTLEGVQTTVLRLRERAGRVVTISRALFYPVAIVLVASMGYRAARQTDLSALRLWPLVGAYVVALVWWVGLALGWASLVSRGQKGDVPRAVAAWCSTQVARYLPGGIWAVVARAVTVRGRIRYKLTAVTAENVIVLLVSLSVGGLWLGTHTWSWLLLGLLVAVPVFGWRWLERRTDISTRRVRRTSASYAVGYVAYGVAAMLVQSGVSGLQTPAHLMYVAGSACVAWAVGLVAVFAPGGVGVRELVYVWMLGGVYPRPELEAAAVTSRLVTVAAEITVLLVVFALRRRVRAATAQEVTSC